MERAGELLARLDTERAAEADPDLVDVGGIRACLLPVDHEPDPACPGNPHARPAADEAADDFVQDRHADLDPGELGGMSDAEYYDRTAQYPRCECSHGQLAHDDEGEHECLAKGCGCLRWRTRTAPVALGDAGADQ